MPSTYSGPRDDEADIEVKQRVRVNRLTDVKPTKVSVVHRGANRFTLICKSAEGDMPDEFGNIVVELDAVDADAETQPTEPQADPATEPQAEPAPEEKADVIAKPVQPKVIEATTAAIERLKSLAAKVKGMPGTDEKVAKPIPADVEQEIKTVAASLVAVAEKYPMPKADGSKPDGDPQDQKADAAEPEPTAKGDGDAPSEPAADQPGTEKAEMPNPVKAKVVETVGAAIERLSGLVESVKGMQTSDEKLPRAIPASVEQALRTVASSLKSVLEKYPGTMAQVAGGAKPDDADKKQEQQKPQQAAPSLERAADEIAKASAELEKKDVRALKRIFLDVYKILSKLDPESLKKEGFKVYRQEIKKSDDGPDALAELKAEVESLKTTVAEQRGKIAKFDNPMPDARSASTGWEGGGGDAKPQKRRLPQMWQPGVDKLD